MEARLAIGMIERPTVEQPRRARVGGIRARPEDAVLLIDFLVGNAVIVTEPTPRHAAQLAKDVLSTGIGELLPGGKTSGQVAEDLPVRTRLARRLHGLPHLRSSVAHAWQFIFSHAPAFGHDAAVLRIVDVPSARELVTTLPVLPPTLAIPLAGDGRVPATWLANLAGGQDEVDTRQTVFRSLSMMFNAPGVQEHGGGRRAPPLRRLDNRRRWYPGESGHTLWGV